MKILKLILNNKWEWHSNGKIEDKNICRKFSRDRKRILEDLSLKSQESLLISVRNTGRFYRFVNGKLSTHNPIQEIKRQDGTFTSNPTEIANIFINYFCSVFTADDGLNCTMPPRTSKTLEKSFSLLIAFIRHFEISNPLSHLDLMVLQIVSLEIVLLDSPYHSAVFSTSLPIYMRYPLIGAQLISFLSTKKVPHLIQGITDQYYSYLITSCCLSMEQVINKDILNYLQANNLLSPDQHGFLNLYNMYKPNRVYQ